MSQESLRRFALSHSGVVTTAEALEHISANQLYHLSASGVIRKVGVKVWAFNFVRPNWEQSVFAAMGSVPTTATLCRVAAAKWWDLGNWTQPRVSVALPRDGRGLQRDFDVVLTNLPYSHRVVRKGIWTTTVVRTVIDLAATLNERMLGELVDEVLFRRMASANAIEATIRSMPPRTPGLGKLRKELGKRNENDRKLMSRFEREVLTDVRLAGFPEPVAQFKIIYGDETYFPDFCWPEYKVIVEVDGSHHNDPKQIRLDRPRRNRLESMGYGMQHFGDETDTPTFLQQLFALLKLRAS